MPISCDRCNKYVHDFQKLDGQQYCFRCWKKESCVEHGISSSYTCPTCHKISYDFKYYTIGV